MKVFCGIFAAVLAVQTVSAERLLLMNTEEAARTIFASPEDVNQLDCAVSRTKPSMGIDLRYHAGFAVTIPMRRLTGNAGAIRTQLRVTPVESPERAAIFSMTIPTVALEPGAKGALELRGEYAVGPGRYAVDWQTSHGSAVCREQWRIEAKLDGSLARVPLAIEANTAAELPPDPFDEPGEAAPRARHSLHVKVLVNFSPAGADQSIMNSEDVRVIAAILRAVGREPRFGRFSVVAFSSDQQRVLDRQPAASKIDFDALGRAVREMRTGVVSISQMQDQRGATRFLENLLAGELQPEEPAPDAVIVISPKLSRPEKLSDQELTQRGYVGCPVFLLSYNPSPRQDPWQGALAAAVKKFYRGLEYTITEPQDLGKALLGIQSKLPQSR